MRWTNGWRLAPLTLALAVVVAPVAAPPAAAGTPAWTAASNPAQAADLRAYLDAVHWYERSIAVVPRTGEPFEREMTTGFLASMTPDQFYARAMPVFARHIQAGDALTLGRMARRQPVPLGRQQAALKAYWEMEKTAGPELAAVWRELVTAYGRRMNERMVAEIRRSVADLAAHRGTGYKVTVNPIGLPTLDRMAWLAVNNNVQQTNAWQRMEKQCSEGPMAVAFLPSTLMASNGLPVARKAVDDCEQALETMEKSNEAAYNELRDGLRALPLPEKFGMAQELDKGSRTYYEINMKLGEMSRQMLQQHRNVIGLVEAKRDHIHLENDRLAFESAEDLAEFNRILDDINALTTSMNDVIYRHRQKGLLHDIDFHDGVKPDGAEAPR